MNKITKVLFTIPNLSWHKQGSTLWVVHPYNICLIAAMIRDQYEVIIIDANIDKLSEEAFSTTIEKHKPDLVGITMLTDEYAPAGHLAAKLVKSIDKNIVTVMGGVYVISSPAKAISDANIDYAVVGEGEYVFKELLGFLNGASDLPCGIAHRDNGRTVIPSQVPFIFDLDALPVPAFDLVDYRRYTHQVGRYSVDSPRDLPYARIFSSRGCGVGCIFCQVEKLSGKRFRAQSPEKVLAEIELLKDTYGIKSLVFDDDNFFISKKRAKAIFDLMIAKDLNVSWNAIAVPVFLLDESMLTLMKNSGCQFIDLAIESGSQRILKDIIKKPVQLDKAVKVVQKAKSLGIDVACNFVIGFPGESWDEIRQTLAFAEEIDSDYVKLFIANPLPDTELERIALEQGALVDKDAEMNWKYGKIRTNEFTPQDLAILRAYEWDRINFKTPAKTKKVAQMMRVTAKELDDIRRETRFSLDFSAVAPMQATQQALL